MASNAFKFLSSSSERNLADEDDREKIMSLADAIIAGGREDYAKSREAYEDWKEREEASREMEATGSGDELAQGAAIGGSIVPGWGHLIGGVAGHLTGLAKGVKHYAQEDLGDLSIEDLGKFETWKEGPLDFVKDVGWMATDPTRNLPGMADAGQAAGYRIRTDKGPTGLADWEEIEESKSAPEIVQVGGYGDYETTPPTTIPEGEVAEEISAKEGSELYFPETSSSTKELSSTEETVEPWSEQEKQKFNYYLDDPEVVKQLYEKLYRKGDVESGILLEELFKALKERESARKLEGQ